MRWTTRNRFAPSQEEAMSVGNLSDVAQIMEAILFSLVQCGTPSFQKFSYCCLSGILSFG